MVSVTFAWHISVYHFGEASFTPNTLDAELSLASFDHETNAWVDRTGEEELNIYLGKMTNIAELPAHSNTYLKLRLQDKSDAETIYNVVVNNIETKIANIDGFHEIEGIDYFAEGDAQNAFDFYVYASTSDNLDPRNVFDALESMTPFKVRELPQYLWSDDLDAYLYVLMKPDIAKIQNIIRLVPIQLSPYQIIFQVTLAGEVKTIDEVA